MGKAAIGTLTIKINARILSVKILILEIKINMVIIAMIMKVIVIGAEDMTLRLSNLKKCAVLANWIL